jgi:hypothetical protein
MAQDARLASATYWKADYFAALRKRTALGRLNRDAYF